MLSGPVVVPLAVVLRSMREWPLERNGLYAHVHTLGAVM